MANEKITPVLSAGVIAATLICAASPGLPAFAFDGLLAEPSAPTAEANPNPLLRQLTDLAQTQSPAEVQELFDSGVPAEFVVNTSETEWQLVAGIARADVIEPLALQQVGPGCSASSMCLKNSSPWGYSGTGFLNGAWANVEYIAAGDRKGRFESFDGSGTILQPGVAFTLYPKVPFTQIQRY